MNSLGDARSSTGVRGARGASSRATVPLVRTKLVMPAPGSGYSERVRVSALLDRALDDKVRLTLLSAPPGYGKTIAVAGWLAARGVPLRAGCRSMPADNDLARFARYLGRGAWVGPTGGRARRRWLCRPGIERNLGPRRGRPRRCDGGHRRAVRACPRRLPRRHGGAGPAARPLPDRARPAVRASRPPDARGSSVAARPPAGPRAARRAPGG